MYNIGRLVSGDVPPPLLDGDTRVIRDSKWSASGPCATVNTADSTHGLDTGGCVVMPGLINSQWGRAGS